jgi:predicted RNA-binding protein with PIN domain
MSHLIDGHNLIGSGMLPGISLGDPNDEARLLERLRAYRAGGGPDMVVFFDSGDSPGATPATIPAFRPAGGVEARFARPGESADDAIVAFVNRQKQPGQFTVVTNDSELGMRARLAGANVIQARQFAERLAPRARRKPAPAPQVSDKPALRADDPAFADIQAAFIEAEKAARQRRSRSEADFETWSARLLEGDPQLAQSAAAWLGRSGKEAALEPLQTALVHDTPEVRAAVALALGSLGNRAALGDLERLLAEDDNSMVREAAAQSLGRIGDRSVEAALTAATSDRKSKVRKAAREALVQIRARRRGTTSVP